MSPYFTVSNEAHGAGADPIPLCQHAMQLAARKLAANLQYLGRGELSLCCPGSLKNAPSLIGRLISLVACVRVPSQVAQSVILSIAILVAAFSSRWPRTDERLQYELVNSDVAALPIGAIELHAAIWVFRVADETRAQHPCSNALLAVRPESLFAPDSAQIADRVASLEADDRPPFFCILLLAHGDLLSRSSLGRAGGRHATLPGPFSIAHGESLKEIL